MKQCILVIIVFGLSTIMGISSIVMSINAETAPDDLNSPEPVVGSTYMHSVARDLIVVEGVTTEHISPFLSLNYRLFATEKEYVNIRQLETGITSRVSIHYWYRPIKVDGAEWCRRYNAVSNAFVEDYVE